MKGVVVANIYCSYLLDSTALPFLHLEGTYWYYAELLKATTFLFAFAVLGSLNINYFTNAQALTTANLSPAPPFKHIINLNSKQDSFKPSEEDKDNFMGL